MADVLEATLPPAGFLAPGAGCTLTLELTPKIEKDAAASLQLLTPTGVLFLPIRCLARRILPSISPSGGVVEVGARGGGVMVAARAQQVVTLTNDGALELAYDIKVGWCGLAWLSFGLLLSGLVWWATLPCAHLHPAKQVEGPLAATAEVINDDEAAGWAGGDESLDRSISNRITTVQQQEEGEEQQRAAAAVTSVSVAGFTIHRAKGVLPGYGQTTFKVEFAPLVPGRVDVPLAIHFTAPAVKHLLAVPTARLVLAAVGRELPVSAEKDVIDFK
jgi:hypothetical protein